MKKKITLLVILAALFALSSCIIMDDPIGSLNVYIDKEYQDKWYVGTILVDEGNGWEKVWDADDHPNTFFKEAHVNLEEGYYDVKFVIYKRLPSFDDFYDNEYAYDVYINGGHATNFRYGRNGIERKW